MDENTPKLTLTKGMFLLFLGLKLAQVGMVADWSWWWVTSPMWITFLVLVIKGIIENNDRW